MHGDTKYRVYQWFNWALIGAIAYPIGWRMLLLVPAVLAMMYSEHLWTIYEKDNG